MNRIVLFDVLKGIAMISVILWHLMNNLNAPEHINSTFIYIFLDIVQLPLFMMVGGYFCYRTKINRISIIKKRLCQLIFPVIFMGLFYILFVSFKSVDFEFAELLKRYYTGTNPYYFLICLFELYCIFLLISFVKISNIYIQTSLYVLVYVCLCLIINSIPSSISHCLYLNEIILRFYWPFVLGILLRQFNLTNILFNTSNIQIFFLIINTILFYCFYISNRMYFPFGIGFTLSQIFTLCLILNIVSVVNNLISNMQENKVVNFLANIGKNSLAIYLLHYFFRFDLNGLLPIISATQYSSIAILLIIFPIALIIVAFCLLLNRIIRCNSTLSLLLLGNIRKV